MFSTGWIWLYIGSFLMLAEIVSPGFVIFFFGLGAATVAVCKWAFPSLSLAWQLALFSISSIFYLLVLRRYMKKHKKVTMEDLLNETDSQKILTTAAWRP